jgi:hypothetical protein
MANNKNFVVKNGLVALSNTFVVNTTAINYGNTTANNIQTFTTIAVSNASGNAYVGVDKILVQNTVVNATITPNQLKIGNTTANSLVNASAVIITGNTSVAQTNILAGNVIIGNTSVSAPASLRIQNAASNTNILAGSIDVGGASFVNTSGFWHETGTVNAYTLRTGTATTINATGVNAAAFYVTTGHAVTTINVGATVQINTSSYAVGTIGAGNGALITNTTIRVGNNSVNTSINSSTFSGTANNASYLGGKAEQDLNVNSALFASNASHLGGVAATNYLTSISSTFAGTVTGNDFVATTNSSTFGTAHKFFAGGNVAFGNTSAAPTRMYLHGPVSSRIVALGTTSAISCNCAQTNYFTATASGATSVTFTSVPAGVAFSLVLVLTNGGAATMTWSSSPKWPGGIAPTLTSSGVDVLTFITDNGGTTWRGALSQKDSR